MVTASNSSNERLERIFELLPRQAFLGSGPWQIKVDQRYIETPGADPAYCDPGEARIAEWSRARLRD
jgi:protein-L-isoaspartate(D-aspartate) O-methyltransferase